MTIEEMRSLECGDIVRHRMGSDGYIVSANYGEIVVLVRTQRIDNPAEWDIVIRARHDREDIRRIGAAGALALQSVSPAPLNAVRLASVATGREVVLALLSRFSDLTPDDSLDDAAHRLALKEWLGEHGATTFLDSIKRIRGAA